MTAQGAGPGVGPAAVRPDRYGAPRRRLGPVARWVLIGLALAAAVAVMGVAWAMSRPGVDAGVTRIRIVSPHRVDVTFEVHKAPSATAICVVRARDASGAQTGYDQVRVGPAKTGVVTVTHHLATNDEPVTGELAGCRLVSTGSG